MRTASGFGTTRSQIFVAIPSVPSEPDERADQVVARVVELRAAERDLGAVRQHHLEAGHVVRREAVLEAVRAARVLGHVAADRADDLARRVRREEVRGRHRLRDRDVRDAGLHEHAPVRDVHLEDPPQPRERDQDALLDRERAAREPRAGAARDPRAPPPRGRRARPRPPRRPCPAAPPPPGSTAYWSSPSDAYVASCRSCVTTCSLPTMPLSRSTSEPLVTSRPSSPAPPSIAGTRCRTSRASAAMLQPSTLRNRSPSWPGEADGSRADGEVLRRDHLPEHAAGAVRRGEQRGREAGVRSPP